MKDFKQLDVIANDMYNKGFSLTKIAKELNMDRFTMSQRLKDKFGIDTQKRQGNRQYNAEYNYFESIDSNEKAYWLGFLLADGHVRKDMPVLELSLCNKDKNHIVKFNKSIRSDYPVKDKKIKLGNKIHSASITYIYSKKMCEDLNKLGCINGKTYNMSFPDIDNKYKIDFIRGFFDGDGSLSIKEFNCGFKVTKVTITAFSQNTLHEIAKIIKCFMPGFDYNIYKRSESSYSLTAKGVAIAREFIDMLYKNSTIHLDRKYNLYSKTCRPGS